jgi:hypothetical protein
MSLAGALERFLPDIMRPSAVQNKPSVAISSDAEADGRNYLAALRNVWPDDQPKITGVEDIGGSIGLVGKTGSGGVVLNSFQLGILRKYENDRGLNKCPASRVGGHYWLPTL